MSRAVVIIISLDIQYLYGIITQVAEDFINSISLFSILGWCSSTKRSGAIDMIHVVKEFSYRRKRELDSTPKSACTVY